MKKMTWDIPQFSTAEGTRRHGEIRKRMASRGIACLIIAGHIGTYKAAASDLRYVSNYCMWFDDEYVVFPAEGEPHLIVWSQIHADWAERVSWIPVRVATRGKEGRDYAGDISRRINALGLESATLGLVNMRIMPADVYVSLREQLPAARFVSAGDLLRGCRSMKGTEELEFVRRSAECADQGFRAMLEAAQPGNSEADLAAECERAMVKAGAELGSFILLRSGPWEEMRGGGLPFGGSRRILKKGDIILDEITPSYGGCYTQLCRPISIGPPPAELMSLYELHTGMYALASEQLRPGHTVEAIEAQVAEFASRGGDFARAWNLQSGELIDASVRFRGELKAGMVMVNHPFTEPRSGQGYSGHTIGDTFVVTGDAPQALTRIPFELKTV
jgi:Xaa-Pro dipeptidase